MEIIRKSKRGTHKILVVSLKGDEKGHSKSMTISAEGKDNEALLNFIAEKLSEGGN